MNRRHFLAAIPALAAVVSLPGLARAQSAVGLMPLRFSLDYRVTSQTSPFFLAQSKGYYRDEGLDVTIDVGAGSVASITRVATGAYDLALGDLSSLIEFQAKNPNSNAVKAVYQYYNRAPFAIIGRKDRGVTQDFASLAGKKVAGAAVESTRRMWPLVASHLRLDPDLFEWVTTDFAVRDNVLLRGDVDAATYFHDSAASLFARMPQKEFSVLRYNDTGLDLYGNAILASQSLISKRPQVVAAFLRATNRALRETISDVSPALAAISARDPIINVEMERARWQIARGYIAAADTRADGLGNVRRDLVERQVAAVSTTFKLDRPPKVKDLFDLSMLPTVAERKVRI
ncbi:ABC transporter substrate-binding protein [Craterilacuibacter sinensis]|uniref:ABC transporter permease n=1 Tax=Craterilacuibacter sinensis TaxID=2686017 RepID=A0A845BL85_9NEIS|nr:ABC transporter substrate-binding protein [Craterilacuibacter sinensis]MXR37052.1 ABC transporter permease [Craterilacuibacter sinensis]